MNKASLIFHFESWLIVISQYFENFYSLSDCDLLHRSILVHVSSYHAYNGQLFFPRFANQFLGYSSLYMFYWDSYISKSNYLNDRPISFVCLLVKFSWDIFSVLFLTLYLAFQSIKKLPELFWEFHYYLLFYFFFDCD